MSFAATATKWPRAQGVLQQLLAKMPQIDTSHLAPVYNCSCCMSYPVGGHSTIGPATCSESDDVTCLQQAMPFTNFHTDNGMIPGIIMCTTNSLWAALTFAYCAHQQPSFTRPQCDCTRRRRVPQNKMLALREHVLPLKRAVVCSRASRTR
jgi:hypothetical protein